MIILALEHSAQFISHDEVRKGRAMDSGSGAHAPSRNDRSQESAGYSTSPSSSALICKAR
jgi:hypothetical protein